MRQLVFQPADAPRGHSGSAGSRAGKSASASARSDAARRQLSLMHVFRQAAETGSARQSALPSPGDERHSQTVRLSREAVSPEELRRHLAHDLASLMNTVRLDNAIDLDDAPHVRRSVINHGFRDLTSVTRSRKSELMIAEQIRQTLLEREPRLNPATLAVTLGQQDETRSERLIYQIEAEIMAYPADIPVGFTAEIDLGAGKMRMRAMRGGS